MKTIIITGIGGVVGQGILRNLTDMMLDVKIIGTNVSLVSAGNYLCNEVIKVPFGYDKDYIPMMVEVCRKENVSLIIPSTDYEAYHLGANQKLFECVIATSPAEVTKFCLDKYLNYLAFARYNIPFASSFLPSEYHQQFETVVVKPREGRGSRNIYVNPSDPSSFDDEYVVQEYLEGPEITTTFYVTRSGEMHGFITFVRELESGNTVKAEVTFDYDVELEGMVRKMVGHYPFRGSCNVQSRVTRKGIIPFEINCRISGTNSIRSQFGFNDVAYTVQEYLLEQRPAPPNVVKGTALRVILDIIYPGISGAQIKNKLDQFYIH